MKLSPQAEHSMKLAKIVSLLTIGIAISLSSTGCRKGLDKTTQIPGRGLGSITDNPAPPRTDIGGRNPGLETTPPILANTTPSGTGTGGTPLPPPVTPETGIPPTDGDFSSWKEDRDTFKAQTVYFDFDKHIVK